MEGSQHGLEEIREDYPEQVGEALKCEMLAILVCYSCLLFLFQFLFFVPAFRSKARTAYESELHTHIV